MENIKAHVRWMIRRDLDEVLHIERNSFPNPWTNEDFVHHLRQRDEIGMVAEYEDAVIGFMVYQLGKTKLHVFDFAVDPIYRRHGIGSQLIDTLIRKLSRQRRQRVTFDVRDSNLPMQLFLRSQGFKAVNVIRGQFEDSDDDAYRFQFHIKDANTCQTAGKL